MYRLLGDNHVLGGLPFSAQVFLRALDGVRNRLADDAGVTGTELRALSRIAESAGLEVPALGDFLELTPGAALEVVDSLTGRKLVATSAGSDPGSLSLRLTPSGHELVARTYEGFQRSINDAAGSLDSERLNGLASGMLKMARKLDAAAAER